MRIDLSALARHRGRSATYAVEELLGAEDEVEWEGPVRGELTVQNTGSNVLSVRVRVQARARRECARCLAGFTASVTQEFEERLEIGGDGQLRMPDDEAWEGQRSMLVEDKWLDVGELVRQQLLLALAGRGLCRPQCRGLCPICGVNLNEGACGCQREGVERPLGRLGEMWQARGRPAGKGAGEHKAKRGARR